MQSQEAEDGRCICIDHKTQEMKTNLIQEKLFLQLTSNPWLASVIQLSNNPAQMVKFFVM